MSNKEAALFSATMVLTAYIDEEGNVKFIKKPWDGTWASLFEEENDNAELV